MPSYSSTVDERVVEMRIDNAKFEAGAKKTISILEQLDKGLQSLGKQNADGFDNIENSLDKVTNRFSAMGIIGDQVLRNLTNKAMELVGQFKNMTTMLTSQQFEAGWSKYAEKTQAIQTIMAATSGKIDDGTFADQAEQLGWVNEQIQKLNKFTDETSYNFLDMVGNIGKFTAAGRELEESVVAMEGVAAWAAISGGRPAEASRAMYNLSQALGIGAVTVQDWKSIENANMATYEFKQQVIETAEELGKLRKIGDETWEVVNPITNNADTTVSVANFRAALAQKWFDNDVLLTVLGRYGEFSDILLDTIEGLDMTATEYLKFLKIFKEGGVNALRDQREELSLTEDDIQALLPSLKELSKAEYDLGYRAFQAAQEAKTFQEAIDATKDAVSTKWMDVFERLFGNYLEAKELWTNLSEVLWNVFAGPVDHLIDILDNANGYLSGDEGLSYGMKQAAGSTLEFEERLEAVGKTMKDFEKAVYSVADRATLDTIENFNSFEEALISGAVSAELFRKALGALDDSYSTGEVVGLNRALNKSKKTMADFEKAIYSVADRATIDMIENFNSVEEAVKNGAISVDLFKKALESLGIDSENVVAEVDSSVNAAVGSLEEMRALALEVLRGDHGNGEERLAWYESMGLDPELMQALAGNLKNFGYYISDDQLMEYMEQYYRYMHLSDRLGFETFAEYLASAVESVGDSVYTMEDLANEADDIFVNMFGSSVKKGAGDYYTAGELFRMGLTNIMEAIDNFAATFDKAFFRIITGTDDYDDQVATLGEGFFSIAAAFEGFTERIKEASKSDGLLNILSGIISAGRLIGKVFGVAFKIVRVGLSFIFKLLSPVFNLLSSIFMTISDGIDYINQSFDESGIISTITTVGNIIITKIAEPINKLAFVIRTIVDYFKKGFETGGLKGGFESVSEAIDTLFQNHPIILKVFHAIEKVAGPLGKVLEFIKNVLIGIGLVAGGIFGGLYVVISSVFSKLGEWFGDIIDWVTNSELLAAVWAKMVALFTKVGDVIKRVMGYAEEGYRTGGFFGAFTAVSESFQRGVKRLIPGGEAIINLFGTIKDAISGIFKKKEGEEGTSALEDTMTAFETKAESIAPKIEGAAKAVSTAVEGMFGDEQQQAATKDRVKAFIGKVWAGILAGLRDIRFRDVLGALRLSVIASLVTEIVKGVTVFKNIGKSVKKIPEAIANTIDSLGAALRGFAANFTANTVLKFAISVGILAFAFAKLAKIPDDDLTHAAAVTMMVLGVLVLLAKQIGIISANIVQQLQDLPALAGVLFGLGSVIAALGFAVVAIALVNRFVGPEHVKAAVFSILEILAAIGLIMAGLVWINHALNKEDFVEVGNVFLKFGGAIALIALGIQAIVLPIALLAALHRFVEPKHFNAAVGTIALVLGMFAGLFVVIVLATSKLNYQEIHEAARVLTRAAAAMLIMALAVQMLILPIAALAWVQTKVSPAQFNKAVGIIAGIVLALGGIFAALTWLLAIAPLDFIKEIGKVMLKIAGAMVLVALAAGMVVIPIIAIAGLSAKLQEKNIWAGLVYLLGTIAAFGALLYLLDRLNVNGNNFLKIAGAIAILAVALLLFTPALLAVAGAVALFTYALGSMDDKLWAKFEKGLKRLGKFTSTLATFGVALLVVGIGAALTGSGLITFAAGVAILVLSLAALIFVLPRFVDAMLDLKELTTKDVLKNLGKLALMIVGVALALGLLIAAFNRFMKHFTGQTVSGLGTNILTLLAKLGTNVKTGMSGLYTKVIDYLKNPANRQRILTAIGTLVTLIGLYLTGVIPGLVHTVFGAVVTLVDSLATELEENKDAFTDALTRMLKALMDVATELLLKIYSKEFWDKMNGLEKVLFSVGTALAGIKLVLMAISGINAFGSIASSITGAGGLLTSLISGYWWIAAIAASIYGVYRIVKNYRKELADAQVSRNEEFFGEADPSIEKRAENLQKIQGYYQGLLDKEQELKDEMLQAQKDRDQGAWDSANEALIAMGDELAHYRTQFGAAKSDLAHDLADATNGEYGGWWRIKKQIEEAGGDLSKVPAYVAYINSLTDAERELGAATEKVEEGRYRPGDAYKEVGEEAAGSSAAVKEFTAATEEARGSWDEFKASMDADGISDIFTNFISDPFGALKEAVAEQGFDINDFISSDNVIDTEKFSSLINAEQLKESLKAKMKLIAPAIPEGVGEFMSEGYPSIDTGMGNMEEYAVNAFLSLFGINSPSKVFANEAHAIPEGVALGIIEKQNLPRYSLDIMAQRMINYLTEVSNRFTQSGANIVQGLINGISSNYMGAYNTGKNLAASVENGFRNRLKIRSPSKVFEELAGYMTEGLAQGVTNTQDEAITSVVVLGDALVDAVSRSMAMVSTVANSDTDFSPRITPVLDMSAMRGVSPDVFSTALGGYNFDRVNEVNQAVNYSLENSEIITAVRGLSDQVGLLGERITNMEVVLDSGALVGNTSERMDAQLGKISARRKRAN